MFNPTIIEGFKWRISAGLYAWIARRMGFKTTTSRAQGDYWVTLNKKGGGK